MGSCVKRMNQWTNPMHGSCTKDQSYGDRRHVTRNDACTENQSLWNGACGYMYLCTVSSEGSMSSEGPVIMELNMHKE